MLLVTTRFVSFDGTAHASTVRERTDRDRPAGGHAADAPRIARGGGYSYVAASFAPITFRYRKIYPWTRIVISSAYNALVRLLFGVHFRDISTALQIVRREVITMSSSSRTARSSAPN